MIKVHRETAVHDIGSEGSEATGKHCVDGNAVERGPEPTATIGSVSEGHDFPKHKTEKDLAAEGGFRKIGKKRMP